MICDPACGTAGFLVAAGEYLREHHPEHAARREAQREHFHHSMFHGFDFDNTMLRIGSMNMLLHGVENPDIRYRDSLVRGRTRATRRSTRSSSPIRRSPARSTTRSTAKDLQQIVKTKKTELLFLALFLRLLKPGGRAAVIVPDGVLFGSSQGAQGRCARCWSRTRSSTRVVKLPVRRVQALRRRLDRHPALHQDQLRRHRPRLVLRRARRRLVLDDKRTPLLPEDKLGAVPTPRSPRTSTRRTTCPTCSARWRERDAASGAPRTAQSLLRARRPTSPPRATTYRSTATRKSSTTRSSIATPSKLSPTLSDFERRFSAGCRN